LKKTIIVCDACEEKIEGKPHELKMFHERRSNGVDTENWYWFSELCPRCTSILAYRLITSLIEKPIVEIDKIKAFKEGLVKDFKCREV
jgi:hypothetical protein